MLRTVLTGPTGRPTTQEPCAGGVVVGSPKPTFLSRARSHVRRAIGIAALATAALTALASGASDLHAQAPVGLAKVGPIDPVTGFPLFYEDTTGLRLGMCTDPNLCFFFPPNPALPVHFPTSATDPASNWPVEFFYFGVKGLLTGTGLNRGLITMGLEGSFANGFNVVPGDQTVFSRIRIRVTGLVDGASYTVTHPYGVEQLVASGGIINMTRDVPLGIPGNFTAALHGDIGPFLTPTGFTSRVPGTYIADGGATLVTVQGSPRGTNYFRVAGPGVSAAYPGNQVAGLIDVVQLDQFSVQGQIATQAGVDVTKAYLSKTATSTSVNVWASTATGQRLTASAGGSLPVAMVEKGVTGNYFARIELGATAPRPASVTVVNTTDFPNTTATAPTLPDLVQVTSAVFTVGGDLVVTAASSDKVAAPALTATVDGVAPALLTAVGGGVSTGTVGIPLGSPPPASVQVTSAAGGTDVIPVAVEGTGTPGGIVIPVVANAGADQTTTPNTNVSLSGLASTGPITSYSWAHNVGTQISLVGGTTATPSFVAPVVTAPLVITFTLTVRDAALNSSTDTVLVTVNPPVQAQDVLTVLDARYTASRAFWRASGTASLRQGQTITIYVGPLGNTTRRIGTAVVDALGNWAFVGAQGSATATGTVPTSTDGQIWVRSSLPGNPVAAPFRRQ